MVDEVSDQDVVEARVLEGQFVHRSPLETAARQCLDGEIDLALEQVHTAGARGFSQMIERRAFAATEVEHPLAQWQKCVADQLALVSGDSGILGLPLEVRRRSLSEGLRERIVRTRRIHSLIRSLRNPNAVIFRSSHPWLKRLILVSP